MTVTKRKDGRTDTGSRDRKLQRGGREVCKVEDMSRTNFSAGIGRLCLWWGGTALALGTFIWITRELCEGEVAPIDSYALKVFAKIRTPWLTSVAVDLTAVGSSTLIILFLAVTLLLLIMLRDRLGVFQLLATSTGAGILTLVTKNPSRGIVRWKLNSWL